MLDWSTVISSIMRLRQLDNLRTCIPFFAKDTKEHIGDAYETPNQTTVTGLIIFVKIYLRLAQEAKLNQWRLHVKHSEPYAPW